MFENDIDNSNFTLHDSDSSISLIETTSESESNTEVGRIMLKETEDLLEETNLARSLTSQISEGDLVLVTGFIPNSIPQYYSILLRKLKREEPHIFHHQQK